MLEKFPTTGPYIRLYEFADRLSCTQQDITGALASLGLMEVADDGEKLPTERAEKLNAWEGAARFLGGGSWHRELLTTLAEKLGRAIITDRASLAKNRATRRRDEEKRYLAKLIGDQALKSEAERLREAELSKLTGIQRVGRMIEMREPVLRAQYPEPGEWDRELHLQHSRAMSLAQECSLDDSYPDFESELVNRVVFTLDELMAAALQFESAGRAIPSTSDVPVPAHNYR